MTNDVCYHDHIELTFFVLSLLIKKCIFLFHSVHRMEMNSHAHPRTVLRLPHAL